MSRGIQLHVSGDHALFTRPEMKVERVSYDVITPSAARGIVEAIYWKPQIRWIIDTIRVLKPIRFTSIRRNEVASKVTVKGATGAASVMAKGHGMLGLDADDPNVRQQRAATVLRDVAYVIDAHFEIVDGDEAPGKHLDMFNRRARKGQCFHRPYLGTREFDCSFVLVEGDPPEPADFDDTLTGRRDLGFMLDDVHFVEDEKGPIIRSNDGQRVRAEPQFYRAIMVDGLIDVAACRGQGVVG